MSGIPKLIEGVMYRVLYKSQSGNYRWYKYEMFASFVGADSYGNLLWSLRPEAGTQQMVREQLLEAYEMPRTTAARMPKRLGPA
jgi:hypothetical protein